MKLFILFIKIGQRCFSISLNNLGFYANLYLASDVEKELFIPFIKIGPETFGLLSPLRIEEGDG